MVFSPVCRLRLLLVGSLWLDAVLGGVASPGTGGRSYGYTSFGELSDKGGKSSAGSDLWATVSRASTFVMPDGHSQDRTWSTTPSGTNNPRYLIRDVVIPEYAQSGQAQEKVVFVTNPYDNVPHRLVEVRIVPEEHELMIFEDQSEGVQNHGRRDRLDTAVVLGALWQDAGLAIPSLRRISRLLFGKNDETAALKLWVHHKPEGVAFELDLASQEVREIVMAAPFYRSAHRLAAAGRKTITSITFDQVNWKFKKRWIVHVNLAECARFSDVCASPPGSKECCGVV